MLTWQRAHTHSAYVYIEDCTVVLGSWLGAERGKLCWPALSSALQLHSYRATTQLHHQATSVVIERCPQQLCIAKSNTFALQENLNKVLVFNKLDPALQRKVVSEMYERSVPAGEILIKEGDSGLAASELYVVKTGKFEVRLA